MQFEATRIPEVVLIKPDVFGDSRGYFFETWQAANFAASGVPVQFVQDNHSHSEQWVLRGLHYQLEQTQGKLVRVFVLTQPRSATGSVPSSVTPTITCSGSHQASRTGSSR